MPLFGRAPNVDILSAKRDIRGLIGALNYEKDITVRIAAAHALHEIDDAQTHAAIMERFSIEKDRECRQKMAEMLVNNKDIKSIEQLIEAIHHERIDCSQALTNGLANLGHIAVEPLITALKQYRYNWIDEILVHMGTPAIDSIVELLRDTNVDTRRRSANILEQLKWQPSDDQQAISYAVALEQWDEAANYGSIAHDILIHSLKPDMSLDSTRNLILVLARLKDPLTVYLLIDFLQHYTSHSSFIPALEEKTEIAVVALGRIGNEEAIGPLLRTAADLSRVKKRTNLPPSSTALSIHNSALDSLRALGNSVIDALLDLSEPPSPHVVRFQEPLITNDQAIDILNELGESTFATIVARLSDKDVKLIKREQAAHVLGRLGWHPQNPLHRVLYAITEKRWQDLDKMGTSSVEPLIDLLQYESSDIRVVSAQHLGKLRDVRAVEPLVTLLHDKESQVGLAAAMALEQFGDERAMEPLLSFMGSAKDRWKKAELLHLVVKRWPTKIAASILREAVMMEDIVERSWRWHDNDEGGETSDSLHSLAHIRQLAHEELTRRGEQV